MYFAEVTKLQLGKIANNNNNFILPLQSTRDEIT